jgi:hypothetical protein
MKEELEGNKLNYAFMQIQPNSYFIICYALYWIREYNDQFKRTNFICNVADVTS